MNAQYNWLLLIILLYIEDEYWAQIETTTTCYVYCMNLLLFLYEEQNSCCYPNLYLFTSFFSFSSFHSFCCWFYVIANLDYFLCCRLSDRRSAIIQIRLGCTSVLAYWRIKWQTFTVSYNTQGGRHISFWASKTISLKRDIDLQLEAKLGIQSIHLVLSNNGIIFPNRVSVILICLLL